MGLTRPVPHREAMSGGPKGSAASKKPPKRPASPKVSLDWPVKPSLGGSSCLYKVAQTGPPWPQAGLTKTRLGGEGTCMVVPGKNEEQNPFEVAFLFYGLQIPKAT